MKTIKIIITLTLLLFMMSCGSDNSNGGGGNTDGSNTGGTETGTTDPGVNTAALAAKVQAVASTLVPSITGASVAALVSSGPLAIALDSSELALTVGTSEDWASYTTGNNSYVLTDVFGDPDVSPAVVTKIRVLVRTLKGKMTNIFSADADIVCKGGSLLIEGDAISIAFFGSISNGISGDRYFDCLSGSDNSGETTIYGIDSNKVVRIVTMSDRTSTNTEEVTTRGSTVRGMQVIYATYGEVAQDGATSGYLDLQYTQATVYSGVDGVFQTSDDVVFKSRSRITGFAALDSSGNPTTGRGDFKVVKFDASPDFDDIITQTLGRGNYRSGGYSLFDVNSNLSTLTDIPGNFCIQQPSNGSGIPTYAGSVNCTDLETAFVWDASLIPFTLSPAITEDFDSKAFFEGNDTDLISNDGSNFSIPSYSSTIFVEATTE
jgi:hypothetical protein